MCLILFAWQSHPEYSLVVAANRDEFYRRATQPVDWWQSDPPILAGRDLAAGGGGTWMGITAAGRFSAVTNVREPGREVADPRSRGELVANYLSAHQEPEKYSAVVAESGAAYNGFNLLAADRNEMWWYSNRFPGPLRVEPGVHGVSNAALDTPWPKVTSGVARFTELVTSDSGSTPPEAYLDLLADSNPAPDDQLPSTGVPLELERAVSSLFIETPEYGTRASTVLRIRHDGSFDMTERAFARGGEQGTRTLSSY